MGDVLHGVVFPYLNFILFLAILIYFSRKPAKDAALAKRREYEDLFSKARAAKAEAEEKLKQADDRFHGLQGEVKSLLEKAQNDANREAERIVTEAREQVARIRQEAKDIASTELRAAKAQLYEEILLETKKEVLIKIQRDLGKDGQIKLLENQIGLLSQTSVRG